MLLHARIVDAKAQEKQRLGHRPSITHLRCNLGLCLSKCQLVLFHSTEVLGILIYFKQDLFQVLAIDWTKAL